MQTAPSNGNVSLEALLRLHCSVITSCVVVRRQSLLEVGLFDETLKQAEDFDLWVRLALSGCRLSYEREVSAYHRLHRRSLTNDKVGVHLGERDVYLKLLSNPNVPAQLHSVLHEQAARCLADLAIENGKRHLMAGSYTQAAEEIDTAIDHYQSRKLHLVRVGLRLAPGAVHLLFRLVQLLYKIRYRWAGLSNEVPSKVGDTMKTAVERNLVNVGD